MNKLKIALLSTAILVGVNHASLAAYTQNDLDTLRELSDAKDTEALLAYIQANPQLMAGNTPLAEALREFVEARSNSGFMGRVFAPRAPNMAKVPDLPKGATSSAQVDFGSIGNFGS